MGKKLGIVSRHLSRVWSKYLYLVVVAGGLRILWLVMLRRHAFKIKYEGPFMTPTYMCENIFRFGEYVGDQWMTRGCTLRKYSRRDVQLCMQRKSNLTGGTHIGFVGDSRVRMLFFQFANWFDRRIKEQHIHRDKKFMLPNNVTLDFKWQPFSNESHASVYKRWLENDLENGRPELVVSGVACWIIWLYDKGKPRDVAFERYRHELETLIVPLFNQLASNGTKVLWHLQGQVIPRSKWVISKFKLIRPEIVDEFNNASIHILSGSGADVWNTSREIARHWTSELKDGLHFFGTGTNCLNERINLLFNYMCNRYMYTNVSSTTCCSQEIPEKGYFKKAFG